MDYHDRAEEGPELTGAEGSGEGGVGHEESSDFAGKMFEALSELETRLSGLRGIQEEAGRVGSVLAQRAAEIERRESEAKRREGELNSRLEELESRFAELEERDQSVRSAIEEVKRERGEVARERAAVEEERSTLSRLAEQQREEMEKRSASLAERERGLGEREKQLGRRAHDMETVRARIEAAAERIAELERFAGEQEARAVSAEEMLESARAAAGRSGEHAAQAEQRAGELERRAAEAERRAGDAESRVAQLSARVEELSAAAERGEGQSARVGELERELAGARAEAERREAEMAELKGEAGSLRAREERFEQYVQKAKSRIEELERRLEEAEREKSAGARGLSEWAESRRRRLSAYRAALRERTRKVSQAKEALKKRHAECQRVLDQRSRVVEMAERLRERERAIATSSRLRRSVSIMFYMLATLTLLGVLSLGVADRVAPPTYAAKVVLEVDDRGRAVGDAELTAWGRYHEQLTMDPRLLETAAERFAQRGIASLASAPALRAALDGSLYTSSREPGVLVIELRGEGAERMERVLDTYATALASVANSTRAQRSDGLPTVIVSPARAGSEPIEDRRLEYAAVILSVGTGAVLVVWAVLWARIVRSKREFEREALGDAGLDAEAWARVTGTT